MKLTRLEVTSLPGFSSPFHVPDLADGITLIIGPNAIGKSSLVRTLKLLLGEPSKKDPLVTLAAEFTDDNGKNWRIERSGQQMAWTCEGEAATRPNLPAADQVGRYCLSMEDLIKADATDESLADELRQELWGGVNLDAVRTRIGRNFGSNERKGFEAAQKRIQAAEQDSDALRKDQEAIPSLESEIEEALEAERHVGLIGHAKELLRAKTESKAAKEHLATFPSKMNKLSGEELDQIQKHRTELEKSEAELRTQINALQQAQTSLERSRLAPNDLDNASIDLDTIDINLRTVEKLRTQQTHQRRAIGQQTGKLDDASKQLGSDAPTQLDIASMKQAEGFAGNFLKLQERKTQIEQRIELLGGTADERRIEYHRNTVQMLRDWIDPQLKGTQQRRIALTLWVSFGLAAASIVSFIFLPPVAPAVIAVLLVVALGWVLRDFRSSVSRAHKSRDIVEQFEKADLPLPTGWTLPEVQGRLNELEKTLADLESACHADAERELVEQKIEQKEAEKQALYDAIGFDPLLPLTSLDRFIRLAKDWDEARLALEHAKRELADTDEAIQGKLQMVRAMLSRWAPESPEDAEFEQLGAVRTSFEGRIRNAREASNHLDTAQQLIKKLETDCASHREDIANIYQKIGLSEEEHQLLVDRVGQLRSWNKARTDAIEAGARERQCRVALEHQDALLELVDRGDESVLDKRLEEATKKASQLESLRNQRANTEARIRQAEQDHAVELATQEHTEARVALEQKRDELLAHEATSLLLGQVEADYRVTHEPKVLTEANTLFQQVTANTFQLLLGDDKSFLAKDTQQGTVRELHELSTGTRMQLLLAVRVAWVRAQSADAHTFPIFLDEALTTSDEHRFMMLAKSLDKIASGSKSCVQIVYLSARQHEQELWRAALGREPYCFNLAVLRNQAHDDTPPTIELQLPEPIPEPEGDATQYAKELGVTPVNPALDAGEIHLFHLLRDDLELLHRFLDSLRISSLGQLESYLQQGEPDRPRLLERCRAARTWVAAWREGRGQPVGALELEASGSFSQRYLKEASALANSQDISGDASLLLTALRGGELKGFQTKKIDDFEAWLNQHQFLDDRAVLSRDERQQRVLASYDLKQHDRIGDIAQCIGWLEAGVVE